MYIGLSQNLHKNKERSHRYSIQLYLILFIFWYSLFALDRIKKSISFKIDGVTITNQIWIIFMIYILAFIFKRKGKTLNNKYTNYIRICLFLYLLVIIIGGYQIKSIPQYISAILLFITPILLFFIASNLNIMDINLFFKVIVITCLFYAVFSIILATNYAFFISLVGNTVSKKAYYSQTRPNMMLGSSIAVSYYFNLTLPLCFYLFFKCKDKKWKRILILTIISNISATFILLSRAASLCTVIILIGSFLFINKSDNNKKNILLIIISVVAGTYILRNYNLARLLKGFGSNSSSVSERLKAGYLGLYIFSKQPFLGSGMGKYFKRLYKLEDKFIIIDGIVGLIDPHNMYILVLSETGLVGFILLLILFLLLFISFSYIKEKSLRWTAYITVFAFLFDSMGGSHLFNSIGFTSIFWIYMGIYNAFSTSYREVYWNNGGSKK